MEKKLSIYVILVPLFAVISCLITSVWFIKYDTVQHPFFLLLGIVTFIDYLISLIAKKVYWAFVDKDEGENKERLIIFLFINILGLIPIINFLILIISLCMLTYYSIKYFFKKNDIKLEL